MSDGAGKDKDAQKRQRDDERVEVAVIAAADAVTQPGAMVIEALWRCKQKMKIDRNHSRTVNTGVAVNRIAACNGTHRHNCRKCCSATPAVVEISYR